MAKDSTLRFSRSLDAELQDLVSTDFLLCSSCVCSSNGDLLDINMEPNNAKIRRFLQKGSYAKVNLSMPHPSWFLLVHIFSL